MKKNLKNIFFIVFIVSIILGSPILLNRINTEKNNNTYRRRLQNGSKEERNCGRRGC